MDAVPQPGPSAAIDLAGHRSPGDVPVLNTARFLGPVGDSYDEEFETIKKHLRANNDLLGPSAPVIFVNFVKNLYKEAAVIAADRTLDPYSKCVSLFHAFDATVLAYKNLSFVCCNDEGVRSVYGYSELALKTMLSRVEAIAKRLALAVHDAHSLTALNRVLASAQQHLSQVRTETDMIQFFRSVSDASHALPTDSVMAVGTTTERLPQGVEIYEEPYPGADSLLRRLHATCPGMNFVRNFHDAVYLLATANTPASLSSALQTRLADKDRNLVLLEIPGDRLFASSLCASAIAFLRKALGAAAETGASGGGSIATYKINYGRLFSKFRGESERNFDIMMDWIKNSVRGTDKFRVFWFPDIENLMSPRTGNDQEHIATIKNSMLQHMDAFNKDRTLRSFLLLFNSSEGALDSAFARRLETVVTAPSDPLSDVSFAFQVVCAELNRYHINLTDDLVENISRRAGSTRHDGLSRTGGFAYVQATLRDLYIGQKLALRYDAKSLDTAQLAPATLETLMGRYSRQSTPFDVLYDLDERPVNFEIVSAVAFGPPQTRLDVLSESTSGHKSIKYNANVTGDPKNLNERTAARTVYVHDISAM